MKMSFKTGKITIKVDNHFPIGTEGKEEVESKLCEIDPIELTFEAEVGELAEIYATIMPHLTSLVDSIKSIKSGDGAVIEFRDQVVRRKPDPII